MALGTRGSSMFCPCAAQLHYRSCSVRLALEHRLKQLARAKEEKVPAASVSGEAEGERAWLGETLKEQASLWQQSQYGHAEGEASDPSPHQ